MKINDEGRILWVNILILRSSLKGRRRRRRRRRKGRRSVFRFKVKDKDKEGYSLVLQHIFNINDINEKV
jgi:hypothetical protein